MNPRDTSPTTSRHALPTLAAELLGVGLCFALAWAATGASAQVSPPGGAGAGARVETASPTPSVCQWVWGVVPSPNQYPFVNSLADVEVIAVDDIWAVGAGTIDRAEYGSQIQHWDGTEWTLVPHPTAETLNGIGAVSVDDVWAVGSPPSPNSPLVIMRWNGLEWSKVPTPDIYGGTLAALTVISPSDIWAVGTYFDQVTYVTLTLTLHWDGTEWTVVPSPSPEICQNCRNQLLDVAAVSENDVWAVGSSSRPGYPSYSIVQHWDGTQWSLVPVPPLSVTSHHLYGVTTISTNDLWAVGHTTEQNNTLHKTLVLHWDGTQWQRVASPNMPNSRSNHLYDVIGLAPDNVWAVGESSNSPLVEHWDGIQWRIAPSPVLTTHSALVAIAGDPLTGMWAVGFQDYYYNGEYYTSSTLTARYTDPCTTPTPTPTSTATSTATATHTSTPTSTPSSTATNTPSNTATGTSTSTRTGTPTGTTTATATQTQPPPTATGTAEATPTTCAITFTDVPQSNTFYPYVRCLACRGIVQGYADGTFRPDSNVTRGQLAKIVSESAGLSEPVSGQSFEDVAPGSTFYEYIERLASRQVMSGYECGGVGEPCGPEQRPYFRPNASSTRGQLTKIVANAAGFQDPIPPGAQTFADVAEGSTFHLYVERLLLNRPGVMGGYPCGGQGEPCDGQSRPYFRPSNTLTRGQTAKIVSNTFFPECNP